MYPVPATINTENAVITTEREPGKDVLSARVLIYTENLPKRSLHGAEVFIYYAAENS